MGPNSEGPLDTLTLSHTCIGTLLLSESWEKERGRQGDRERESETERDKERQTETQ